MQLQLVSSFEHEHYYITLVNTMQHFWLFG